MEELQLRIRAIIRRTSVLAAEPDRVSQVLVGDVLLDTRSFKVTTPSGTTLLTNVQFDLLYHLMSNANEVFTSQQLLQDVWDYPRDTGSPELVRAHIKNLRDKIEANPKEPDYIRTIQGHGYTFAG
jgi:DNA-binding response OmpR family regulator